MVIETERLILREYTLDDFEDLYEMLSDPETMQHYPQPYDAQGAKRWLDWSLHNYQTHGFGWWAVILKENGTFLGDCGITMQPINGEILPEIGYHLHKKFWRQGYAGEAARAVRDWFFTYTRYDCVYSYMNDTNVASYATAAKIGMEKIKEYTDETGEFLYVYALTRSQWEKLT